MSQALMQKAIQLFDGPQVFARSKVIHSTSVYMNSQNNCFTLNIGEPGTPRCNEDFWLLNFLRCYSDCILTTGQILRKEPYCFEMGQIKELDFKEDVYFN